MKILFLCGREAGYARNSIILKGLKKNGAKTIDCTSNSKIALIRYISVIIKFFINRGKQYDVVFVGFFGQPLVPIVKMFTKKPIIFDAFMSAYDTVALDKKKVGKSSIIARFFRYLDKKSCELSKIVLLDTNEHINYFVKEFKIPKNKFVRALIGANDGIFHPIKSNKKGNKFIVEFHGNFIPLQGIHHIIKAAKVLENHKDIEFEIIGAGQTYKENVALARKLNVKNVRFLGKKSLAEIPKLIARCDVGLGIFGDTNKAKRVIPNKAYEIMAMKKALITADTPAAKELLTHKKDAFLCKKDAKSLANAILTLKNNKSLRNSIANKGYKLFSSKCSPKVIGKEIVKTLKDLC